jgi:hypothetical protein
MILTAGVISTCCCANIQGATIDDIYKLPAQEGSEQLWRIAMKLRQDPVQDMAIGLLRGKLQSDGGNRLSAADVTRFYLASVSTLEKARANQPPNLKGYDLASWKATLTSAGAIAAQGAKTNPEMAAVGATLTAFSSQYLENWSTQVNLDAQVEGASAFYRDFQKAQRLRDESYATVAHFLNGNPAYLQGFAAASSTLGKPAITPDMPANVLLLTDSNLRTGLQLSDLVSTVGPKGTMTVNLVKIKAETEAALKEVREIRKDYLSFMGSSPAIQGDLQAYFKSAEVQRTEAANAAVLRQARIEAVQNTVSFVNLFLAKKNPQAARDLSLVVNSGLGLSSVIEKYAIQSAVPGGQVVGAINLVGGLLNIGQGLMGGLGSGGPGSGDPLVLAELNAIRDDIRNLASLCKTRFDGIDSKLDLSLQLLSDSFERIDFANATLKGDVADISKAMYSQQMALQDLQANVVEYFGDLAGGDFKTMTIRNLGYRYALGKPLPESNYGDAEAIFVRTATSDAVSSIYAAPVNAETKYGLENLAAVMATRKIEGNLNYLAGFAKNTLKIPLADKTLPNISVWLLGADSWLRLNGENPDQARLRAPSRLSDMIQGGVDFQEVCAKILAKQATLETRQWVANSDLLDRTLLLYIEQVKALSTAITAEETEYMHGKSKVLWTIDPFGGPDQPYGTKPDYAIKMGACPSGDDSQLEINAGKLAELPSQMLLAEQLRPQIHAISGCYKSQGWNHVSTQSWASGVGPDRCSYTTNTGNLSWGVDVFFKGVYVRTLTFVDPAPIIYNSTSFCAGGIGAHSYSKDAVTELTSQWSGSRNLASLSSAAASPIDPTGAAKGGEEASAAMLDLVREVYQDILAGFSKVGDIATFAANATGLKRAFNGYITLTADYYASGNDLYNQLLRHPILGLPEAATFVDIYSQPVNPGSQSDRRDSLTALALSRAKITGAFSEGLIDSIGPGNSRVEYALGKMRLMQQGLYPDLSAWVDPSVVKACAWKSAPDSAPPLPSIKFSWTQDTYLLGADVLLLDMDNEDSILADVTVYEGEYVNDHLPYGRRIRAVVRGILANGGIPELSAIFRTPPPPVAAPAIPAFVGPILDSLPLFTWGKVDDCTYEIQLNKAGGVGSNVKVADTSFAFFRVEPGEEYAFTVVAVRNDGIESSPAVMRFSTYPAAPLPPVWKVIYGDSANLFLAGDLAWVPVNADSLVLRIIDESGKAVRQLSVAGTERFSIASLPAGPVYTAELMARNKRGESASIPLRFRIASPVSLMPRPLPWKKRFLYGRSLFTMDGRIAPAK